MADIWERWNTPENTADRCPSCNTSPAHFAEWQACEEQYQRLMDPRLSDRRPGVDLRSRRADLQLALQRRAECRESHACLQTVVLGAEITLEAEVEDYSGLSFADLKKLATERKIAFSPVGLSKKKLLELLCDA